MAVTKKGRVLRDTSSGEGLVFVEGNQYPFRLEGMWRSEYAPKTNMAVDVDFDDLGKIVALRNGGGGSGGGAAVGDQASAALDAAGVAAKKMAADFQARGVPVLQEWAQKIGYPTLAAYFLLIAAWFWMPLISLNMGLLGSNSVTFYGGLKLLNSGPLALGGGGGAGFYGFLVFVSLIAMVLPQVWKDRRAGWGMTFPLLLMALVAIISYFKMQSQFSAQEEQMGAYANNPEYQAMARQAAEQARAEAWKAISFGFGLYIGVIASLYLAWQGFRKTRTA